MLEIISRSPEETIEFGKRIGALLKEGDVIAFKGSMGAGKTTFTHGLAMGMGLGDEVYSPTFTLVNEYRGEITLCHFDMYRIESAGDLETTGFYDYLSDGCVMAIEWSEKIIPFLPKNTIFITIEQIDDDTRKITVEGDERFDSFRV